MSDVFNSRKAYASFKKMTSILRFPVEVSRSLREPNNYEFKTESDPFTVYKAVLQYYTYPGYALWGSIDLQTNVFDELSKFSPYLSLLTESRVSKEVSDLTSRLRTTADESNFTRIAELLLIDFQSRIDAFPVIRSMQEYLEFMLPYFDIPAEKCFDIFSTKEFFKAELPGGKNLEVHFGSEYFYGPVAMFAWLAKLLQHDAARQRQRLLDVLHLPLPTIPQGLTNEAAFQINDIFGYERQRFINFASKLFDFEPFKADCIEGLPILSTSTAKEVFTGFDRFMGLEARVV